MKQTTTQSREVSGKIRVEDNDIKYSEQMRRQLYIAIVRTKTPSEKVVTKDAAKSQ